MKRVLAICAPLALMAGCSASMPPAEQRDCHLHKMPLRKDIVPAAYGPAAVLPDFYKQARDSIFPLANQTAPGAETAHPVQAEILYCPECRNAKDVFDNAILWIENDLRESQIRRSHFQGNIPAE